MTKRNMQECKEGKWSTEGEPVQDLVGGVSTHGEEGLRRVDRGQRWLLGGTGENDGGCVHTG